MSERDISLDASGHTPLRRRIAAAIIFVSLGPVLAAQRDLRRRSRHQIRGSKFLWRIGSTNAIVATVYLRWGRRTRGDGPRHG